MKLSIKEHNANYFILGTLLYCFFAIFLESIFSLFMVYLIIFMKEYFEDEPNMTNVLYTMFGALPVFILLLIKNV